MNTHSFNLQYIANSEGKSQGKKEMCCSPAIVKFYERPGKYSWIVDDLEVAVWQQYRKAVIFIFFCCENLSGKDLAKTGHKEKGKSVGLPSSAPTYRISAKYF